MKRLFIDVEKCYKCKKCEAECETFYHKTGQLKTDIRNNGIEKLLAYGAQYIVCRRCEEPFCINTCPNQALEKDEKGILHRYSFRCTSCKSCSVGCPFGTIYPEILSYKTSFCDLCLNKTGDLTPLCVKSCPKDGLKYIEIDEDIEKNIYLIKDGIAIHAIPWNKEAVVGVTR